MSDELDNRMKYLKYIPQIRDYFINRNILNGLFCKHIEPKYTKELLLSYENVAMIFIVGL